MATPLLGLLKRSETGTMIVNVSAREWRAVREGETHAATKTSTNNTPESFIVGIGASGALLAGAAIVFVTLVGIVSFNVWPTGNDGSVERNVELSAPTPRNSQQVPAAPLSAAAGQVASTSVPVGSGGSGGNTGAGGNTGGGDNGQRGGPKGVEPKAGTTIPPATATPPSTNGSGDSGGSGSAPGSASKSPAHPVHPAHPENPHQDISDGTSGKDDPSGQGGSDVVVHGKGRFSRPTPPSSTSPNTSGNGSSFGGSSTESGRGRGSPSFRH